ncbi:MAG: shikimate dehydrogenase [Sphingomonadales bacterium]|jgi:shikimate dehydrogenase|nr:shikimate dehydrogenase [Sphingomonadales bacterium]
MGVPYAEVIGDPIAHSKSPLIHKFWLEKLGIEGDYRAVRVAVDELQAYLESRRSDRDWRGCNVTMPHKERIMPFLDTATRDATRIGAVNTIRKGGNGRLHGRNTDLHGVCRSLDHLIEPGLHAVLIGAGGGARAAARALAANGVGEVTVINRSLERAEKLLRDFHLTGRATAETSIPTADLVINAAPPYASFALDALGPRAVIFDMVYSPREGSILNEARGRGLRVVDGLTMLTHQAGEAFSVFFKRARPPEADAELRELLTR